MPQKEIIKETFNIKHLYIAITLLLLLCVPFALRTKKVSIDIPSEDPIESNKLNKIISISKYDTEKGINDLESISFNSQYTNYKKKYILARLYEKNGKKEIAEGIYEELIEIKYPLQERVIFNYANLKSSLGDDKTAIKYFNKLLQEFPHSRSINQAKYHLAQALLRVRYTRQALDIFKLLSNNLSNQYGIASNYYLGEHEYYKQNYGDALKYWRIYLKNSPGGRFALDIANLIIDKIELNLSLEDKLLLGDVFYNSRDYKNASKYYLVANKPSRYYELGYSLFRIGNQKECIDFFKEYAKSNPKNINARFALYYSSLALPGHKRKSFWDKMHEEIPELEFYTLYKRAVLEDNERKRNNLLKDLITKYPNTMFALEAVWDLMWSHIKRNEYHEALDIGKRNFELSNNSELRKSDTRIRIGFWLGKILEKQGLKDEAKKYYEEVSKISFDDFYSHRARQKLFDLSNHTFTNYGSPQTSSIDLENFSWSIPNILKLETIKEQYGEIVAELVNLQQFDEAIELIGMNKSPSKKITAWLQALNKEHMSSINLASELIKEENLDFNDEIYKLSYPLYFWYVVLKNCSDYKNLDPFLVFGIIRQESRFECNAKSISNAHGLMQLIPPTASQVAHEIGLYLSSIDDLNNPDINTKLGIKYISGLVNYFGNNVFAVGSYNAGPGAIKRWLQKPYENDLDLFVENIPYSETKDYVKKVLAGYWTYKNLYSTND